MDNEQVILKENPFNKFFSEAPSSKFDLDLSRATLIEVLSAYEKHKQKLHPKYNLNSIKAHLSAIQFVSNHVLVPKDITDLFYATLSEYFTDKGLLYSTQDNYIGKIRTALEWGIRHGCSVSSTYDCIDLPKSDPFTIALTPDEVSHIAHFNCEALPRRSHHRKNLERVRDMFALSCSLGQRHSDMVRISRETFDRNIFSCVQQKTGNKARLDIERFSMFPSLTYRILEKYSYQAPYRGSINNYNRYIHELLTYIGEEFDQEYKVEQKINGNIISISRKKRDLIASHTARRTFVTYNAFKQTPLAELSKATGHSSLSSLQKYIKYGD